MEFFVTFLFLLLCFLLMGFIAVFFFVFFFIQSGESIYDPAQFGFIL